MASRTWPGTSRGQSLRRSHLPTRDCSVRPNNRQLHGARASLYSVSTTFTRVGAIMLRLILSAVVLHLVAGVAAAEAVRYRPQGTIAAFRFFPPYRGTWKANTV